MIRVTYFIVCLLLGITLVSCIRDEALNAEADILTCTVPGDILKRDPIIENNKVVLMVTADADLTHQAPEFTLTPGATISPASGTERDFTTPQFYTVTSEDGNWKKEYQVTYIIAGISSEYHFENVKDYKSSLLKYVYNIFYENDSEGKWVMDWASGNTGFALTGAGTEDPASFPTSSYAEGKMGKCVKLETKSTGDFGSKLGMPIAAGNLFMGTFSVGNALTDPLKATMFGVPFEHIPTYLKGYYKYKAGEVYKDENGEFIIAFFSHFIKGLVKKQNPFKTGWQGVKNEYMLLKGLFSGGSQRTKSRFTRELPQTAAGFWASYFSNLFGFTRKVSSWGGATVSQLEPAFLKGSKAFTLGSYIMGGSSIEADPNNVIFQHEYGHYLQSQEMGWSYLFKVAIPSLKSAAGDGMHCFFKTEQDANMRALIYLSENVEGFYRSEDVDYNNKGWDFWKNSLDPEQKQVRGRYYDVRDASVRSDLIKSLSLTGGLWYIK